MPEDRRRRLTRLATKSSRAFWSCAIRVARIFSYLVVRGPTYGTIWDGEVRTVLRQPLLSFGDWYRNWAAARPAYFRKTRSWFVGSESRPNQRPKSWRSNGGDLWREREFTYDAADETRYYLESSEIPAASRIGRVEDAPSKSMLGPLFEQRSGSLRSWKPLKCPMTTRAKPR